ncbi:scavenger receptor cysteine-rich type 1 protein M130 [Mastacembelus armatus]|uniref:Scavenger receptor cysteine-rich type 1 protein M130-like n=1 Tax=Mastacembelus armatus TaxID=205130 RepID=A0A3Q3MRN3_9TELE|nr:scavenger receptor cysteine-rich type 1 protein M130-like [Mastacembelus armatus]
MMWLLLFICIAHTELVVHAQGKTRLILAGENNPCEGHIKLYRENKWGYVGDKGWKRSTEEVVCRTTHCGDPLKDSTEDVYIPVNSPIWLNEVNCSGNEPHLEKCLFPGWNISVYRKDTVKKIKCSDNVKISLDRSQCAGVVQYSKDGGTHSGYFCDKNWGLEEANLVCNSLQCGQAKKIGVKQWENLEEFQTSNKTIIKCLDIINTVNNLWQCVTQESSTCQYPATVICEGHKKLQLKGNVSNVCSGRLETDKNGLWTEVNDTEATPDQWCQQMDCGTSISHRQDSNGTQLTCTDNVNVVLMDNDKLSQCYGAVHIKLNDSYYPVCGSQWNHKEAETVCKELNCGNVISFQGQKDIRSQHRGIMDLVTCEGNESSLWHCRAKRDKKLFPCSSNAYVTCADSIQVRLMDSPGKCAGRVEIKHEGKWKQVDVKGWADTNADIVCEQLNCGKQRKNSNERFSQGSHPQEFLSKHLNCDPNVVDISECFKDSSIPTNTVRETVGITCEAHKVVFLTGNDSCSGMVGIEHGTQSYWLSGSNETWNKESANVVCQQLHCGKLVSFTFESADKGQNAVWDQSYNCSSNDKSLFDCETTTASSYHNSSIATVKCSGKIQVNLTSECWGNVNICVDGMCGGVCADTWTDMQSLMICKNLGCGNTTLAAISQTQENKVIIKSLHTTKDSTNLTQSNIVKYAKNDNTCNQNAAYVVCPGSVKVRFSRSRDKCSGNVEVSYQGKWLPVCKSALGDVGTQNTICEELKCGRAADTTDYFGPQPTESHVISQIKCTAKDKKSIKACSITPETNRCELGGLQCSKWKKIKVSGICSGPVFVLSAGKMSPVSIEGWTDTEGTRLCKDLKCGEYKSKKPHRTSVTASFWNRMFNCANKSPRNIWDCENQTSPTLTEQLYIECKDEPKVKLSGNCGGEVSINNVEVCNTNWKYSDLICQEQNCSNAIGVNHLTTPNQDKKYYHVSCEDYHYNLGQCKTVLGKCSGNLVSAYCVANVMFNTTKKCGGQLLVNYRNKWESVCPLKLSSAFKEKLCLQLNCGSYNDTIAISNIKDKVKLDTSVECSDDIMDLRHCVRQKTCNDQPAEIYCNGYVRDIPIDPNKPPIPIVPIILGLIIILVVLMVIIIFVRSYISRRAKNAFKFQSSSMLKKDVEFESGNYDDINIKVNEMEDFSHGRFRSESEMMAENDSQSNTSFPYDDIDKATEAQPLTSLAATATHIHDDDDDHSNDGVAYEVEEPESYDDIANPEITQIKAEVHNSPKTTRENDAVAPADMVRREEDYLVPGQDG